MTMLAEFGTMSLAQVLAPAIQLADGYPIEAQTANSIETNKSWIKQWKYSPAVFLPHAGETREAPEAGEMFRQPDLAATLRKLVDAEAQALKAGKSRKDAILAAYDRFYKGDIAEELVRGFREQGGLFTAQDLAAWKVKIEEPLSTNYKGIEVYKLREWQQGPVMLQALNILETMDVKSLGYNTPKYMHTLYQTMNLAYADRDFYYGDPDFPPDEPIRGLLSKDYARARAKTINHVRNDPGVKPGDPYPFQAGTNPFEDLRKAWPPKPKTVRIDPPAAAGRSWDDGFYAGTTSIQAADAAGWVISVTPSGAWIPSVIAGRTGIGVSQRAQSFVLDPAENPYNVLAARQTAPGDADADAGDEGRSPLDGVLGARRRFTGPEPPPVLSQHRRVRDDAAAVGRSAEHQLVSDDELVQRPHGATRAHARGQLDVRGDAGRAPADGLHARVRRTHVGPDYRHLVRSQARHDVGRRQQSRRGLRHRMVAGGPKPQPSASIRRAEP